MNRINLNSILHFIILILINFIFIITNHNFVIVMVIILYFIYLFLFGVDYKIVFRNIYSSIGISLLVACGYYFIFQNIYTTIFFFIKNLFFYITLFFFFQYYTTMELFYTFEIIFFPLDFLGINSRIIAWKFVSFIRNIKIFYLNINKLWKDVISNEIVYPNKTIYDKIEPVRQQYEIAKRLSIIQIQSLNEIMCLRLFKSDAGRTNYRYKSPSKSEVFFVIVVCLILISEVIL